MGGLQKSVVIRCGNTKTPILISNHTEYRITQNTLRNCEANLKKRKEKESEEKKKESYDLIVLESATWNKGFDFG